MARAFWLGVVPLAATLLPIAPSAAVGAVLFSDNFEVTANGGNDVENGSDPTTGTAPFTTPLHADIGSYDDNDTNGRVAAYGAVMSNPTPAAAYANAPSATATGGSHLLRLQPPSGGSRVVAVLSQPASVSGSAFHVEFDLYASSSVNFGIGSQIPGEHGLRSGLSSPSSGRPGQSVQINLVSGNVQISRDTDSNPATANVFENTGLTFTAGVFQRYQIDYVLGTNQITLTAGTQTPVTITAPFMSGTDSDFDSSNGLTPFSVSSLSRVDTLFFGTGSAGSVGFVDNVEATGEIPEPAALGLLGAAGLLAVRRPRKSRA